MNYRKSIFLVVPLLLSAISGTQLHSTTDEGTYLGRAMSILEGFGPQDLESYRSTKR
jgi:hypothetical protein